MFKNLARPSGKSDDPRAFPRANVSRQPLRTFHCLYQTPACWLPDMLVVAAEGLVYVEQEGSVGAPADGALGRHTEAVERGTTAIGYDVNKPVKSSFHSKKVKI